MATRKRHSRKSYKRAVAAQGYRIRRGLKAGRYRTKCSSFSRPYCFTKSGHKTTKCTGHGGVRRTIKRCRDAVSGKFTKNAYCARKCGY